jgi:ribonuclease P protein component
VRFEERLTRRAQFRQVYDKGTRLRGRFMTWFVLANGLESARLGIAASQKIGNAVTRNRAKRVVRELFRNRKPQTGIDIVVIPHRELPGASFRDLAAEYQATLNRAEKGARVALEKQPVA